MTTNNQLIDNFKNLSQITIKTFKKKDWVYQVKDHAGSLFLCKSGMIKITNYDYDNKEVIKSVVGKNQIFGLESLVNCPNYKDNASVLSEEAVIHVISREELMKLMANNSDFSILLIQTMSNKIINLEHRLESLLSKDARARVIDFIKQSSLKMGIKIGYETLIKHNFTQQNIANLTGTSRQTVTSIFNQLKAENIIHFSRNRILIRDLEALK